MTATNETQHAHDYGPASRRWHTHPSFGHPAIGQDGFVTATSGLSHAHQVREDDTNGSHQHLLYLDTNGRPMRDDTPRYAANA